MTVTPRPPVCHAGNRTGLPLCGAPGGHVAGIVTCPLCSSIKQSAAQAPTPTPLENQQ